MAATDIIPTPAEFDKVRTYLEYQAAQLPGAHGHGGLLSFAVDPEVELIFGKAPTGAFASECGLIEYVLDFVNGDAKDLLESDPRRIDASIARIFQHPSTDPQHWRDRLKQFLSQLRADKVAAQKWVTKQLPDIWALPWGGRTATGIGLHFRILLRTSTALMQFVVLLLVDESRGFNLCQCKLASCSRFFLKTRPAKGLGAPRQAYCTKDHMDEAHRADAIKRAERSRARKAAKKHKRRRS
jgi:hypothetical protein